MASARMYPAPETEAAPVKDLIGEPGTKEAWARMERDIILNATRQSLCLTEQVYWLLILTSRCGPTVRDGCFLRDRRGYTIKDKRGQEIPLRQRDVCEALDVSNRSLVHKVIRRLVAQKRLVIGSDEIWYPVMDPVKLAELLASESVTGSKRNNERKTHYIGIRIPDELYAGDAETVTETVAGLEKIDEEFATAHKCLLQQHRAKLQQYISDRRIIIEEKIEEIREEVVSQSVDPVPDPVPEPTDRLTEIEAVIPSALIEETGEVPTPQLLRKIADALGETPPEMLAQRIAQRRKAFTSLGLLVDLASDARESWSRKENRTRRDRQAGEANMAAEADRMEQIARYEEWQDGEVDRRMAEQYPEGEPLETAVKEQLQLLKREQAEWFGRVSPTMRRETAINYLRRTIRDRLPTLAEWSPETG